MNEVWINPNASPDGTGTITDPAPYEKLTDPVSTLLVPGTIVYVMPGTYGPTAPLAFSGDPSPTEPIIMAAVNASNRVLHPARTVEGTGILDVPSMPTIRPVPGVPVADAVPGGVLFHGLHMLVNLDGYAVRRSTEVLDTDGVCLSSCHVQNESATANAGGLMLFQESLVVNCDVTVRDGSPGGEAAEACVRGVSDPSGVTTPLNAAVQVVNSRLRGGRYGVIQLRNTTVANCVLRDHSVAALWNPVVATTGAVQGWTIHVTADRIGDFWKAHAPEPDEPPNPSEPLAGLYILNCHVTNASGYLVNFENWQDQFPLPEPVLTGVVVRGTRVRLIGDPLGNVFRNVDEATNVLTSLVTEDLTNPDDSIDYVDAALLDYRLVPTAPGKGQAVMSGWDLGAHLNEGLFA